MKKAVNRIAALALVIFLVLGSACASADGGDWTCQSCGQAGNTGNFCSNCGAAKPSADWTCASCGQTGNTAFRRHNGLGLGAQIDQCLPGLRFASAALDEIGRAHV